MCRKCMHPEFPLNTQPDAHKAGALQNQLQLFFAIVICMVHGFSDLTQNGTPPLYRDKLCDTELGFWLKTVQPHIFEV